MDDKFSWKSWCEEEDFKTWKLKEHFLFQLKPSAKMLKLTHPSQVKAILTEESEEFGCAKIDWDKIAKEYDGVDVPNFSAVSEVLHGWDCNSIVVFNESIVVTPNTLLVKWRD